MCVTETEKVDLQNKRASELVNSFFGGGTNWRREHGRMHTEFIIRSDVQGMDDECEAYRQAAEAIQERGYRVKYRKQLHLDTGDHRYFRVGIYLEF